MTNLRITPIGTCRIHTPLKRGSLRYPIDLELGRNYGFVHTAAEALQLIRFLHGEIDIPAEVAPLVVNGGEIAEYQAQSWSPADLHVIEISSAKRLVCGDHAVQINYVSKQFADFFANRERSRNFWSLIRKGHQRELFDFLKEEQTFLLLSRADRELLRSLRVEQQSFRAIKTEMAEIVERVGADKLMFVTHVNAKTPNDELIAGRDRLIRWVKLAGEQMGVKVFDPTAAMQDAKQELALEKGGLDLTHYTPTFSDRIYDELHRFHIAGLMGAAANGEATNSEGDQEVAAAARFEAMLQSGNFLETAREVHAALTRFPDSLPLIELRGFIRAKTGDYPGAVEDLSRRTDDKALSQPSRSALLTALTAVEDYQRALTVAANLIADEYADSELFASASKAAEQVGDPRLAIDYAKQAFRLDRSDLSQALRALRLLKLHGNEAQIALWRQELLENLEGSSTGAFDLCQWALENRDEPLFVAVLPGVGDKSAIVDLVEDAFRAGLYGAVADSVATLVRIGRLAPNIAKRRAALIEEILDKGSELFESGKAASAYRCAKALAALAETPQSQLRTSRLSLIADRLIIQWIRDIRQQLREAEAEGPASVMKVAERLGDLVKTDASIVVTVARALNELGRAAEALRLLRSADEEVTRDKIFRRWTGRIAVQAEEYAIALEMFGSLRDDSSIPATLRTEAERILSAIEGRSLRQLRNLIMADEFDDALGLAGAITRRTGDDERVQRELARMYKRLRSLVVEIEKGDSEADEDELERVLRFIAKIRPDDQSMLRRLALELMRQFRFAEAAEVWNRIKLLAPDNESASRALSRCEALARRASGPELNAAA